MSTNGSDKAFGFALNEEQQMIQNLAREFARNEIAPVAEHYDSFARVPLAGYQESAGDGPDDHEHAGEIWWSWA